jgi:hypothetical protein
MTTVQYFEVMLRQTLNHACTLVQCNNFVHNLADYYYYCYYYILCNSFAIGMITTFLKHTILLHGGQKIS